ncbi:nucleotidyltransferase family protein [Pseudomonas sp. JDS28PS106]|uniref:nucleotidyltransferase family protein n=1 Tax=Pseudomonas sp. JDS28PS106 TaxID=2497235 RepID=UPI002FD09FFE
MSRIDSETTRVFGLVLAAGRSRRFGGDKRHALLPCGRSMLQASIGNAVGVFDEVWVVLRGDDDPASLGVPDKTQIVRSPNADLGMGNSLAAGIAALQSTGADAVAVLLADMPWIGEDVLIDLARLADPERIALPCYQGHRGHPVIIGRRFWPELLRLTGDQGARAVIARHAERVDMVECDDAGVLRDADTPEALSSDR